MCWQCDHPGATWHDYLEHLRELLEEHCWIVQGVQRERHRPPYAYTVGLAAHDGPELVVTGMPYDRAVDLLDTVAGHVVHGQAPRPGEVIPLRGGPVIEIVRVAEPSTHLAVAAALNGPRFSAVQLVYADDRGHWPWDVGFRGGRGGQPVLGARSPGAPQTGAPWTGAPRAGAPRAGAPQAGAPRAGAPQAGAPRAGAPQAGGRRA